MPIPIGVLAVAGASGGAPSAFDLLESSILSSDALTVTFSNLNNYSAYKHLQIRAVMRTSNSSESPLLNFNNDTTSSYSFHQMRAAGNDGQVYSVATANATRIEIGQQINGDDSFAAWQAIIDIVDFSNTSKNKTIRAYKLSAGFDAGILAFTSGVYRKTDAITSISFTTNNVSRPFGVNTRFSLYGLR